MKKKLADEIGKAFIRLHCSQKPLNQAELCDPPNFIPNATRQFGVMGDIDKINNYLQPFRDGCRPRMTPEEIYQELSGLTIMEICEELSSALDILNSIAEIKGFML